jgi:serine phosphatase RsbU (regulator of sigma subunit)
MAVRQGLGGLDAVRYRLRRLALPASPLGGEIEGFARWVEAMLRSDPGGPMRIELVDGRPRFAGGDDDASLGRWPRVWRLLGEIGVAELELDPRLESNQVADVLTLLVDQRRILRAGWSGRPAALVDCLRSPEGLLFACTITRLAGPRLEVSYSYCMTRLSSLVKWFKERQTHLRDHRALFRAAPRYAAVVGLAPMVVFLLYTAHGSWSLLLATSLLGSALLAAGTYLVFMTVGSVEYDNEEQAHSLRRTYDRLRIYADRIRDDMERARVVQQRLMPDLRRMPRADLLTWAARFEPQDDVGGDYFDAAEMPGGRVAVIFADVSGHGLGAALVTAILKSTFESWLERDAGIAELAEMLNRRLVELTPDRSFAAVALGIIDTARGSFRYCNCGHSPHPYLIRAGERRPQPLDAGHMMILGVMPKIEVRTAEVELEPGDIVVFATDGITEAENQQGEAYGVERVESFLREHAHAALGELVAALSEDVARFGAGRAQSDDRAILAVQVRRMVAGGP